MHDRLNELGVERCLLWADQPSGLRAVVVIDDLTLGPAAGGIRTRSYPSLDAALADAAALARAMTFKCALGGLTAGGCKIVVLDQPDLDRPAAFERLGQLVQELGGLVRTAGDLGTAEADLQHAAKHTRYLHLDQAALCASAARGLIACIEACVAQRGNDATALGGLKVAVQGCGAIGAAVAKALAQQGVELLLSDVDTDRATRLADELGAALIRPDDVLSAKVDVLAPCAVGGVVTEQVARSIQAWAMVGAANNILSDRRVAATLAARDILFVPDIIASAGAAIDGIGRTVMGLSDRTPLIDALGTTARDVLVRAAVSGSTTLEVAEQLARERISAGAVGGGAAGADSD
ncbi:MAG: amino acid dehydrogenase [Deltaproteobacteria bacterium]|nr:MAG: amino acid dehydrogenase [Deltaproteobacteria bacterium]